MLFFSVPSFDIETGTNQDTHTITLNDVFQHVDRSEFPLLWRCVLEVHAIMATTVSCEQTFSCLKHSNHVNMKSDNLCSLVDLRLSIRGNERQRSNIFDAFDGGALELGRRVVGEGNCCGDESGRARNSQDQRQRSPSSMQ